LRINWRTVLLLFVLALTLSSSVIAAGEQVTIYKIASCSCCKLWMEHLKQNDFRVLAHDVRNTAPYRQKYGVPETLQSCHTAVVENYVVEGHVPAREIKRIVKERPAVTGLAVPGMPLGSPGMEPPKSSRRDAYSVVLIAPGAKTSVYQAYPASE